MNQQTARNPSTAADDAGDELIYPSIPEGIDEELIYPSSDGRPMAETDTHRKELVVSIDSLEARYAEPERELERLRAELKNLGR